ncbi:MAG: hypothetical protein KME29_06270 [Calothrix sp. FI2-JRJ7]|nr:hypothetical protein [Calothrix sp. FI2-JRJ7]
MTNPLGYGHGFARGYGWTKLQGALESASLNSNYGNSFTLEELGARMELSLHTVSKIMGRCEAVDKSSLESGWSYIIK